MTYLTQGQITALRLEKELGISPNVVSTGFSEIWVSSISTGFSLTYVKKSIMITSDGFVVFYKSNTDKITFNLEHLKSYKIITGNNLNFYF